MNKKTKGKSSKRTIKLNEGKIRRDRRSKSKKKINGLRKRELSSCFLGKVSKKNRGFSFVEPLSDEDLIEMNGILASKYNMSFNNFKEDLYIPKGRDKGANDKDIVLVKIVDYRKNYEGEVFEIVKRDTSNIVGIYEGSKDFGFVVPFKKGIATDIYVPRKSSKNAKSGDVVMVKITKFPKGDKKIEGEVLDIVSNVKDPMLDLKLVMAENNIGEDFPEKVKIELKNIPEDVSEEDIKFREDYTYLRTYTIDGEDAKDFDDAISILKHDNIFKLYVHIADVAEYIKEDSELDQEARLRGFSIYLVNKVIPMLPFEISNNICSLKANNMRLTLTLELDISEKGEVLSKKLSESYIIVDRRMTYTKVQDILDGKVDDIEKEDFKLMQELALILKEKRKKEGYISFSIPEPRLIADELGNIIAVEKREPRFSDEIIEQFMILANEEIAKIMQKENLPGIYRVHDKPDVFDVLDIAPVIQNIGYELKFLNDSKYDEARKIKKQGKDKNADTNIKVDITSKEYASYLSSLEGEPLNEIISMLLLRTMKLAKYSNMNLGHFGLGIQNYLHFTAPIRRYTDLFVHRVLKKYLRSSLSVNDRTKYLRASKKIADDATMIENKITNIEREYTDKKIAEFMQDKIGSIYDDAQIVSITDFAMFVKISGVIEGAVRYSDTEVQFNESLRQCTSKATGKIYKIGDMVRVRVESVDIIKGNVDLILFEN